MTLLVEGRENMNSSVKFSLVEHSEFHIGDGILVIPNLNGVAETSKALYLEEVELEIWRLLELGQSTTEIVTRITQIYDQDVETVMEDVQKYLNDLLSEEYIKAI